MLNDIIYTLPNPLFLYRGQDSLMSYAHLKSHLALISAMAIQRIWLILAFKGGARLPSLTISLVEEFENIRLT